MGWISPSNGLRSMLPTAQLSRCCLLLLVLLFAKSIEAATYFVRTNGNDQAAGTTKDTAFKSLTRAAQVFGHGDSIIIAPGLYRESLLLAERFGTPTSPLTLIGDESGERTSTPAGPIIIQSDQPTTPALRCHRLQHLVVEGLTFGPGNAGISLEQCRDILVRRCTLDRLMSGVTASRCLDLRIEACEIKRCGVGVALHSVVRCRISHITAVGCSSTALSFVQCGTGALRNSLFTSNNSNFVGDELSAA
ncbi:MAG: DUF1565 domain-containing protein, partial [Nitrospira sp.]|nr:DUF1565 domain-containing protein [Nitrospira sp.]